MMGQQQQQVQLPPGQVSQNRMQVMQGSMMGQPVGNPLHQGPVCILTVYEFMYFFFIPNLKYFLQICIGLIAFVKVFFIEPVVSQTCVI